MSDLKTLISEGQILLETTGIADFGGDEEKHYSAAEHFNKKRKKLLNKFRESPASSKKAWKRIKRTETKLALHAGKANVPGAAQTLRKMGLSP